MSKGKLELPADTDYFFETLMIACGPKEDEEIYCIDLSELNLNFR